jgi:hypothetical protein
MEKAQMRASEKNLEAVFINDKPQELEGTGQTGEQELPVRGFGRC